MNELARQNTEEEVHMNIGPQPNFEIQPAHSFDLSPLDFYVFADTYNSHCIQLPF
jgi:hypothetical protein